MSNIFNNWRRGFRDISFLVAFLWCVEVVNFMMDHGLNLFGIYPREFHSLPGILLWPLLHGSFQHLLSNTLPLLIMGCLVASRGTRRFVMVSLFVTILSGLCVWCFGREAYHVGASGLVFGFFGYLVALGIYEKSLSTLAISLLTLFFYGGLIFGVLPGDSYISWEGHLAGLFAGILAARLNVTGKSANAEI